MSADMNRLRYGGTFILVCSGSDYFSDVGGMISNCDCWSLKDGTFPEIIFSSDDNKCCSVIGYLLKYLEIDLHHQNI